MGDKLCAICGIKAPHQCSGCRAVSYCSRDHQKDHWKEHKLSCHPFKVEWSLELGHHLVAMRDLKPGKERNPSKLKTNPLQLFFFLFCIPGEMILQEDPLMVCPEEKHGPVVCLGCCHDTMLDGGVRCPNCDWRMCGKPECSGPGSQHALGECHLRKSAVRLLPRNYFRMSTTATNHGCFMVLRCLAMKEREPAKWDKLMNLKYCGPPERLEKQEGMDRSRVVQLVRDYMPSIVVPEDWIYKICTIFALNGLLLSVIPGVRNFGLRVSS